MLVYVSTMRPGMTYEDAHARLVAAVAGRPQYWGMGVGVWEGAREPVAVFGANDWDNDVCAVALAQARAIAEAHEQTHIMVTGERAAVVLPVAPDATGTILRHRTISHNPPVSGGATYFGGTWAVWS